MAITKIAQVDVGAGGAASISFTAIPQTYTDLLIMFSGRANNASYYINGVNIVINSLSPSAGKTLGGDGTSAFSGTSPDTFFYQGGSATASTFGNTALYFPNYSGTTTKSISVDTVSENNATNAYLQLYAGTTGATTAITSISLSVALSGALFVQYSSATLYGISKSGATGATVA